MVLSCAAYKCLSKFIKKGQGITFHSFPKNENRRKLWETQLINNGKTQHFKSTNYTKVCSRHFEAHCFNMEKFGGTHLKGTAIPTLFNFPEDVQTKKVKQKSTKGNVKKVDAPGSYDVEKAEKTIHQSSSAYSSGVKYNEHQEENSPDSATSSCRDANVLYIIDSSTATSSCQNTDILENTDESDSTTATSSCENTDILENIDESDSSICRIAEVIGNVCDSDFADTSTSFSSENATESRTEPDISDFTCTGKRKRKHYFGDFTLEDMNSPTTARQMFNAAATKITEYHKESRLLRQKVRRMKNKISSLEKILRELRRNFLIKQKFMEKNEK